MCGCLACMCLLSQKYDPILWIMLAALVFDFLDGFLANVLHANTDLGKELDSLSDMVSFGFFPGFMMYYLILLSIDPSLESLYFNWWAMPGFLITMFAAIRLANYNVDDRNSLDFFGLPTPAATLFILGIFLLFQNNADPFYGFVAHTEVLYFITIFISFLMVSNFTMLSLRTKGRNLGGFIPQIIFIFISIVMMILFRSSAWAGIILTYIILSLFPIKFRFAK